MKECFLGRFYTCYYYFASFHVIKIVDLIRCLSSVIAYQCCFYFVADLGAFTVSYSPILVGAHNRVVGISIEKKKNIHYALDSF